MSSLKNKLGVGKSDGIATICLALLLVGAAHSRLVLPKASDAAPYHDRVRAAASAIPLRTGDWIAEDVAVPSEAVDQLRPNVIISRRLRNVNTGAVASLLFVQCRDVRDLAPHYPPVCYPGQGLMLTLQEPLELRIADSKVQATRYTFESNNYKRGGVLQVDNFMILPDGAFRPDMQGMERRIGADERYYGAAQIQILHSDNTNVAEQTAVSEAILEAYRPLIDAIRGGVRQ